MLGCFFGLFTSPWTASGGDWLSVNSERSHFRKVRQLSDWLIYKAVTSIKVSGFPFPSSTTVVSSLPAAPHADAHTRASPGIHGTPLVLPSVFYCTGRAHATIRTCTTYNPDDWQPVTSDFWDEEWLRTKHNFRFFTILLVIIIVFLWNSISYKGMSEFFPIAEKLAVVNESYIREQQREPAPFDIHKITKCKAY